MKKSICIFFILFSFFNVFADESHYKNISKIEMEVLRNEKIIGYSNYFFKHIGDTMIVENYTKFNVEMFGINVFTINSKSKEIYEKDKLLSFESSTSQNDKKKFVKLTYDKNKNKFIINGSSYVGEANQENIIGNWWNAKILETKTQISPLSGSIKKQEVKFTNEDEVEYKNKKIKLSQFKLKSTEDLPDDKRPLKFNLKWDEAEQSRTKVQYFISQAVLQAAVEAAANGVKRENLAFNFSYPEAYSTDHLRAFKRITRRAVNIGLHDENYKTQERQSSTYLAGSSMGGLISAYAICEYPNTFGSVACFSTHWTALNGVFIEYLKNNIPNPSNHKFYFDYGTLGLDSQYETYQIKVDSLMIAKGYEKNKSWLTKKFEGHGHNEKFWRSRFHYPFEFFFNSQE